MNELWPTKKCQKKKIIIEEEEDYEACDTHEKHKTSSSKSASAIGVSLTCIMWSKDIRKSNSRSSASFGWN